MTSLDVGNLRLSSDSDHEEEGFGGYDVPPTSAPAPRQSQSQPQGEMCCARAQWLHSGDDPEIFASGRACGRELC